jgi:hypothetical protein
MSKATCRIENWKVVRVDGRERLIGTFFDHHTIKDGTPGTTGPVIHRGKELAETDYTIYKLGKAAE